MRLKYYISKLRKPKLIIGVVFFIIGFQLVIESEFFRDRTVERIHAQNLKAVQLLTQYFYFRNWAQTELGQHPFAQCPEKRCYAFQPNFWFNTPYEDSDGNQPQLKCT